jgi:hypothetical protein
MPQSISWLWLRIQTILQKFTIILQKIMTFICDSVPNLMIQIKQNNFIDSCFDTI